MIIRETILVLTYLFCLHPTVVAQSFDFYITGTEDQIFIGATEDSKGNYILISAGDEHLNGVGNSALIKINRYGEQIGSFTDNDSNEQVYYSHLLIDTQDFLIVGGSSRNKSTGLEKINFWKFDSDLKLIWSRSFGGSWNDIELGRLRFDDRDSTFYFTGWGELNGYWLSIVGEIDLEGDSIGGRIFDFGGGGSPFFDVLKGIKDLYILANLDTAVGKFNYSQILRLDSAYFIDTMVYLNGRAKNLLNTAQFQGRTSFEFLNDSIFIIHGVVNNKIEINWSKDYHDNALHFRKIDLTEDTTLIIHTYNIREQAGYINVSKKGTNYSIGCQSGMDESNIFFSEIANNFFISKIDKHGSFIYSNYYSNNSYLNYSGILSTSDGGTLIYGSSYLEGFNGPDERDAYALKVDSNGYANITPAGMKLYGVEQKGFKMYPNPAYNDLNINLLSSGSAISVIRVLDVHGRSIYYNEFKGLEYNVNTSFWNPGIYLISLETEAGNFKNRLIKR